MADQKCQLNMSDKHVSKRCHTKRSQTMSADVSITIIRESCQQHESYASLRLFLELLYFMMKCTPPPPPPLPSPAPPSYMSVKHVSQKSQCNLSDKKCQYNTPVEHASKQASPQCQLETSDRKSQ